MGFKQRCWVVVDVMRRVRWHLTHGDSATLTHGLTRTCDVVWWVQRHLSESIWTRCCGVASEDRRTAARRCAACGVTLAWMGMLSLQVGRSIPHFHVSEISHSLIINVSSSTSFSSSSSSLFRSSWSSSSSSSSWCSTSLGGVWMWMWRVCGGCTPLAMMTVHDAAIVAATLTMWRRW